MTLAIESLLASKYRIVRQLGEGGMGVVYAGDHLELQTRVAIKVLQPELAQDPQARARFLREARLAASVEGEHCTRIHDVGSDAGVSYLVMEHLVGEALEARLQREGRLDVADAATVMMQVLDALSEAHGKGLVHRDLKPANLFLVDRPGEPVWIKVLDFGISKAMTHGDSGARANITLTGPRTMLGSPGYMSPEQLRDSASVDARADVWGCGVVLFELLTGKLPFEGPSIPELHAQIVSRGPRSFSDAGAEDIPPSLMRIVERCLRSDPAERPQTAYELAAALSPFAHERCRALLPRIRAWCKQEGVETPEAEPTRRRLVAGLALVAAAGALAFFAASVRSPGAAGSDHPESSLQPVAIPKALSGDPQTATPNSGTSVPAPPAPPAPQAPKTSPTPDPAAAASVPVASPAVRVKPRSPRPTKPPERRIQDLDGIDLLP